MNTSLNESDDQKKATDDEPMRNQAKTGKAKALILSGAIFPGTGQLSQGKRLMGALIIGASVILLLLIFKQISQELVSTSQAMARSGNTGIGDAFEASQAIVESLKASAFFYLFYGFVAVWLFSIIEVFREPK